MTSQTNMTARNLRQFGKRQLPPLLSEYWLVADESNAKHFQDFKRINKVPPISENGGDWKGVCGDETSDWHKKIEESYASKPGTLVLKPKEGKEDLNWCGVFRSPKQAVEAASQIVHPLDAHLPVPDPLIEAVFEVLSKGTKAIADQRVEQCKKILKLVSDCKEDEDRLHSSMHPDVARVLQGKRLLVWKQLLIETGYEDVQVVEETISGFPLVGPSTVTEVFPLGATPAQQSIAQEYHWEVRFQW